MAKTNVNDVCKVLEVNSAVWRESETHGQWWLVLEIFIYGESPSVSRLCIACVCIGEGSLCACLVFALGNIHVYCHYWDILVRHQCMCMKIFLLHVYHVGLGR